MKQVVVLDAVGTLIYPNPVAVDVYYEAGLTFGSQLSRDQVKASFARLRETVFWSDPDASIEKPTTSEETERTKWALLVTEMFGDVTEKKLLFEYLWEHFSSARHWSVFADVEACLNALANQKIPIYVGSNFDSRLIEILPHYEIFHRLDGVFVSAAVGFSKPELPFFQQLETGISRDLGTDQLELIMVGDDRMRDFDAPVKRGWRAYHLNRKATLQQELGPFEIRSLNDLVDRI